MWPESAERQQPLRTGLTTGSCATACSVAAARLLLTHNTCEHISVTLPKGQTVELSIDQILLHDRRAKAVVTKDAGDDPDITHGARVFADVQLITSSSIEIVAANGVGTVTKPGLALAVGQAAINPVPRQMITQHLQDISQQCRYNGGYRVAVGVEGGEELAKKTMNPRLGIAGGLSILGTTGIVRPYSCSAYIASIRQGMEVCVANDVTHIAATTGSASELFIQRQYRLTDTALIEMGDFIGVVLKYLKKCRVKKLSICGGFGKISKLAMGHMDLHSRACAVDFNALAELVREAGGETNRVKRIRSANTSIEVLNICQGTGILLGDLICQRALDVARRFTPECVDIEIWAIDRQGRQVGFAGAGGCH